LFVLLRDATILRRIKLPVNHLLLEQKKQQHPLHQPPQLFITNGQTIAKQVQNTHTTTGAKQVQNLASL